MKVEIQYKFTDKHTGQLYRTGDVVEMTQERIDEINAVNAQLIKVIGGKAKAEASADDVVEDVAPAPAKKKAGRAKKSEE